MNEDMGQTVVLFVMCVQHLCVYEYVHMCVVRCVVRHTFFLTQMHLHIYTLILRSQNEMMTTCCIPNPTRHTHTHTQMMQATLDDSQHTSQSGKCQENTGACGRPTSQAHKYLSNSTNGQDEVSIGPLLYHPAGNITTFHPKICAYVIHTPRIVQKRT